MKQLIGILSILAIGMFTMTGCNQDVKQQRLSKIDSLGTHLNYIREVVDNIDPQVIENRVAELNRTGEWFLENLNDTLSRRPGIQLGDHLRCIHYYDKAMNHYDKVKNELKYSEEQLQSLRNDVKENFYSEEEFEGYFETEAEAITRLSDATTDLERSLEGVNAQYKFSKEQVKVIRDSVEAHILSPNAKKRS